MSSEPAQAPVSRQERKERTRAALLQAALNLLEYESFSSLSLRQLAREVGIVPTAFYRHFASVDELGLALVDETFATLGEMIRDVRREDPPFEEVIDRSVDVVVEYALTRRPHFRFIGREMYGGVAPIREAIALGLEQFQRELAVDLARMPPLRDWGSQDLALLSDLIVQVMTTIAARLINSGPEHERELAELARQQLTLVVLGVVGWKPGRSGGGPPR